MTYAEAFCAWCWFSGGGVGGVRVVACVSPSLLAAKGVCTSDDGARCAPM